MDHPAKNSSHRGPVRSPWSFLLHYCHKQSSSEW
jgi:hypothetical protein